MKPLLPMLAVALVSLGCAHSPSTAAIATETAPPSNQTLSQFSLDAGTDGWQIENDSVMGGLSRGRLSVDEAGNAVFAGEISLENDGGFSSIQRDFPSIDVSPYRALSLGLKGDGKRYQVRVESSPGERHAYAQDFQTSGDWQVVEIPFADFYAIRHGDRLDLPNYPGRTLSRVQLLAGEGKAEAFRIEIDRVWLVK